MDANTEKLALFRAALTAIEARLEQRLRAIADGNVNGLDGAYAPGTIAKQIADIDALACQVRALERAILLEDPNVPMAQMTASEIAALT